jgi:hypothetical protein
MRFLALNAERPGELDTRPGRTRRRQDIAPETGATRTILAGGAVDAPGSHRSLPQQIGTRRRVRLVTFRPSAWADAPAAFQFDESRFGTRRNRIADNVRAFQHERLRRRSRIFCRGTGAHSRRALLRGSASFVQLCKAGRRVGLEKLRLLAGITSQNAAEETRIASGVTVRVP